MLHTKGIVLSHIKYGETSIICKIFTEVLGVKSYIIKGARQSKSSSQKANLYHPGAILDLVVYNNPNKQLQFIKEAHLVNKQFFYENNVTANCIMLFCVELMQELIIDELPHDDVFFLYEYIFRILDRQSQEMYSNLPIFFALNISATLGYSIEALDNYKEELFDIENGIFTSNYKVSNHFLAQKQSELLNTFLQKTSFEEVSELKINNESRRLILNSILNFLQFHAPNFKELKTLPVLTTVLS